MSTEAARARAAAMSVEAKKDRLTQAQTGDWRITFTVSPLDMPQSLMASRPGTRYMLALVEIGDDEQPILSGPSPATPMAASPEPQTTAKETDGRRSSQDKVVQRCAILCGDDAFQEWLWRRTYPGEPVPTLTEPQWRAETAAAMRLRCRVASRADLAIDTDARHRFLHLEDSYMRETGQRTADPNRRSA